MNEYPTVQSAEALLSLSSLLNPKVPGDSSDDDMPDNTHSAFTPGSIGGKSKAKIAESPYVATKTNPDDIWAAEEVPEISVFQDDADKRPEPEYEILYKQKVSPEDMFLGLSGKNQSSACCEDMVININLPEHKMKDVDLDIKENYLTCMSPKSRLILSLPHPVNPKEGNAKWDGNKEVLQVTLTMKREYDFVNFQ